jgi:hypothetical protein
MLNYEKYGVCFWLLNKDKPQVILNNNWEDFDKLNPQGKVFNIEKEQGDYFEISYGDNRYIILKDAIEIINYSSILNIGSSIYIKNRPNENGIIVERFWHFKVNEPFYNVSFEGKISSNRFFSKDILKNQ